METFKKKSFTVEIVANEDVSQDDLQRLLEQNNIGCEILSETLEDVAKLRAWHIINGVVVERRDVETPDEAKTIIRKWIDNDIQNPQISYNAFGLEEFDPVLNTYCEYYNEDGDDIMEEIDAEDGEDE